MLKIPFLVLKPAMNAVGFSEGKPFSKGATCYSFLSRSMGWGEKSSISDPFAM